MNAQAGADAPAFASLYAEVQQFYASHMQRLDSGAADEWADDFTQDGSFHPPTLPQPVRGRAALAAAVRDAHAGLRAAGEQHRHWHGMLSVTPQDDGSLHVRCYALVFATPKGGEPRPHRSCVCEDVLVREDGELRINRRTVTRDDMP
ncbi:nuclear transport factor 2 family protein (plasmid) [Streptomyces sp. NBC_00390]|uniref:nuclear transport factor 2 family protein n=1 Tax=Streptomyces sp. NBC_00390 TaxID=2975736 RepID=UPI002E241D40